ncbi:hypothetical protein D8S78_05475 [Natrialba swarupiae]|nr:hypothetical protein [Natrialba swarupiae]
MPSSNTLLVTTVVCLLVALVVPTAAVSVGEETASDGVVLEPTSAHATIDDGELRLDLEALNSRATTDVDGVFAIEIRDDAVDRVWVESAVDGVAFYDSDDRTTIDESTRSSSTAEDPRPSASR